MRELDSSHYEISVRVGSRWEIHARYPVSQKDAAVEEARDLERAMSAHVKVSRETFDTEAGLYKEIIVYRTAGAPSSAPARPAQKGGRGGGSGFGGLRDDDDGIRLDKDGYIRLADDEEDEDDDDEDFFDERPRRKRKPKPKPAKPRKPGEATAGNLILRVLLVTLLSFIVSGAVTWALSGSEQRLYSLQHFMGFGAPTDVLATVFLTLFILSFLALALVLLSDYFNLAPSLPAAKAAAPAKNETPAPAAAPASKEQAAAEWLSARKGLQDKIFGDGNGKKAKRKKEGEGEPEEYPEEDSHWEAAPGPEPEEPSPPEEPPAPPAQEEPPSEIPEEEPVGESNLSEAGQTQRQLLGSFMEMVQRDLAQAAPRMDSSTRFAVCLFVSGAVESLANDKGLPREETVVLLSDAVETLGTPPEQAARFAETYENYLLNPRYLEMFESGRLSVNCFLEGDSDGAHRLAPSLEVWRNPRKDEQQAQGTVAVMFTDMVGSTDLNQTVGDARAQHVVHTHNRIVRGVLADYYGREVKHTGDGIMASFANTSNAVKAGIVIMKRVAANNRAEKDLPLTLRIGINVGEPIQENNDLFGVTVQMAARLCAAAQPTQIIVSEAVKAMCAGKDIKFMDRGTRLLKGIPDPVPVFEPVWDPAPAPAQQAAASQGREANPQA
jgi:class 3 adenylate cyclase